MVNTHLNPRSFMHRRLAKHLRFHEREFYDLYNKALSSSEFLKYADLSKLNANQIVEEFVLFLAGIEPANIQEVTAIGEQA